MTRNFPAGILGHFLKKKSLSVPSQNEDNVISFLLLKKSSKSVNYFRFYDPKRSTSQMKNDLKLGKVPGFVYMRDVTFRPC